jgi:hypothetical protein
MAQIPVDPDGQLRESGDDSSTPDIEIFGATTVNHLFGTDKPIKTFTQRIGECNGLPGTTLEITTLEDPGQIENINQMY